MTTSEVLEYALHQGYESAFDLLILCGPDGFSGSVEEYTKLYEFLEFASAYVAEKARQWGDGV